MSKIERRYSEFTAFLEKSGRLDLPEIQKKFGVSASTARRLCITAEKNGLGVRTYGGGLQSLKRVGNQQEYLFEYRNSENIPEKSAIGKYASRIVESGDILFVTGGTTTYQFILHLAKRLAASEIEDVTIMTNSLLNVELAEDYMPIIITGGQFRKQRRDVAGYVSEAVIRGAQFNRSFIGVDGVELTDGLIASDNDTGSMDRLVTSRSEKVYILADHSKFTAKSYISYERFLPNHIVITDSHIGERYIKLAAERHIALEVVPVGD